MTSPIEMWCLDISARTNLKFARMYKHSNKRRRKSEPKTNDSVRRLPRKLCSPFLTSLV